MDRYREMLSKSDPEVFDAMVGEERRQRQGIELIPSENYTYPEVLSTLSSVFTNKYAEGYPGRRYYGGQEFTNAVERLARDRAKQVFRAEHANVQPLSGSPMNQAVYMAFMKPGDTILGIKGRVGFEAPAAHLLIQAHRELEKIVLSKWQRYQKDQLADFYGMLLHEGQYFDPAMRDVEAFLDSSQDVVTGTVALKLFKGHAQVTGCTSPHSMFDASAATYGEEHALWDGRDAQGFTKLASVQAHLAQAARPSSSVPASTPNPIST